MVERLHNLFALHVGQGNLLVGIAHQLAVLFLEFVAHSAFEVGHQTLVDHVLHNLARRVERAGLFAGRGLCLRVVGGQQILETLPSSSGSSDTS